MFKTFLSKIILTFTIVVSVVIAFMVYLQNYYYTGLYTEAVLKYIETEAKELSVKLTYYEHDPDVVFYADYVKSAELISGKYNALIWILDINGNILESVGGNISFEEKKNPDVDMITYLDTVLRGNIMRTTEFFSSDGEVINSICVPVFYGERIGAILVVNAKVDNIFAGLWKIPFIVFFMAVWLVVLASVFISKPLYKLNKLSIEARKGNFNYRYDINSQTEIGHIGENFNIMMDKMSKMEQFSSDFVQNASHELKAPITVISGYCQALMDDSFEEHKRKEYLGIILGETDRMKQLIETLISLSKIESGNDVLNKEHFNINDVLSRNLLAFEIEIEKKALKISVNYEHNTLEVCADKAKIEQVITNLIHNAIKYTDENDSISIMTKQVEAKAYIEIMDTGIGIEQKDIDNIFDRFYTVDKAKTPGTSGSGLGLSLVKRILELHDSKIYVESNKGEYTKFYFYLDM